MMFGFGGFGMGMHGMGRPEPVIQNITQQWWIDEIDRHRAAKKNEEWELKEKKEAEHWRNLKGNDVYKCCICNVVEPKETTNKI